MDKLIITPKTKIWDLLEAYPELEEMLTGMAPQFRKLTNPLLRKTITRITSLSQAAAIGSLNVEDMVNRLRKEVGQDEVAGLGEQSNISLDRPEWYTDKAVVNEIDVRDMLHRGEHPVHEVLSATKKLNEGEVLKMIAPFIPVPLIDKSLSLGHRHWVKKISEEEFFVYFIK
jgi:hypothetical protein